MIGVVSFPEDPHAERVIGHLREDGHEVVLLHLADLPDRATLTIDYAANGKPQLEYRVDGEALDLRAMRSVWWRRPQPANPSTVVDPDVRLFTGNEWQEAIAGLWQLLDARWVNDPGRDEIASRKALQLEVAAEVGMRVPRTLITSDPDRARSFIEREGVGKSVYKTFSCTHQIWRETRLVHEDDVAMLDAVRLAPVIFQEFIAAADDLRITVIGDRLFPAAIDASRTEYPVDFRMSLGEAETSAADLPDEVSDQLLGLMRRLGLVYGAIDMKRTPDGEYVFLEVNTAGEFLFVEERTGQPIARALADWLAGGE